MHKCLYIGFQYIQYMKILLEQSNICTGYTMTTLLWLPSAPDVE